MEATLSALRALARGHRAGAPLRRPCAGPVLRPLVRQFEARSGELGITAAQFQVLRRLWAGDGMLVSVLANEICCHVANATGILDRLEAKGLIRRERSLEDRRAVRIF